MSHKNRKNKQQADENIQSEGLENLIPPVEEFSPQVPQPEENITLGPQEGGAEPKEEPAPAVDDAPKAKKPNGFMSMLEEANERRKQRVKKYLDGKRDKEA